MQTLAPAVGHSRLLAAIIPQHPFPLTSSTRGNDGDADDRLIRSPAGPGKGTQVDKLA
jgi:hypothetical protein